jgi:hypothetical protein
MRWQKSSPPSRRKRSPKKLRPHWDGERHELWFGDILVKRYSRPAKNQWLLLDACEELGWPEHMPDSLPPSPKGPDHSIRLRQAVRSLNHGMVNPVLLFECDHTGQGFTWRVVAA